MNINKENIIYCLKHPQLSGCLDCPHYMELDGSLFECRKQRISEAVKIIEKYQKIQEIVRWNNAPSPYYKPDGQLFREICEVFEDGNDDSQ